MSTSQLLRAVSSLQKQELASKKTIFNYTIPDLWNCFGFEATKTTPWGELLVNPYSFYRSVIEDFVLKSENYTEKTDFNQPLSKLITLQEDEKNGDWLRQASVYSMMIRTSTAWDHDRSGDLEVSNLYGLKETGTFIKSIALLPLLKKMGINTVYILPISQYSLRDKKGDLGSPYAVSSFCQIDPFLYDDMVPELTLAEQFQAFVEACHIVGLRVAIDFIPRTNSVESELILDHPDWFYWIYLDQKQNYYPPHVPSIGGNTQPTNDLIPLVYQSHDVWEHIRRFTVAPNLSDIQRWKKFVTTYKKHPHTDGLLSAIEVEFGITIAPAFSDHINDPQPPWTDVTFFRLYNDHPVLAQNYVSNEQAPYILFDTIKGNAFKGNTPNQPLWDTLANVLPYYQKNFGIDGARIDMGHALPRELVTQILTTARNYDEDFAFIAEELYANKAWEAHHNGYNMIIGQGFFKEPRIWDHQMHNFMFESKHLPCPVFAAGETHDSPRLAAREGGRTLSKMLTALNLFMPNGIPFINSGQEVYETQPMNTGLDCRPNENYMLNDNDPYNGKLALFDKVAFHWLNDNRWDLADMLEHLNAIRQTHLPTLLDMETFLPIGFDSFTHHGLGFGYALKTDEQQDYDNMLVIFANTDVNTHHDFTIKLSELRHKAGNHARHANVLYSTQSISNELWDDNFDSNWNLPVSLAPGEVRIFLI
ncbi:MAG: alpha-amylase [Culicoidibacterales bacterium]